MHVIFLFWVSIPVSVYVTGAYRLVAEVSVHFCSGCCLIIVACLNFCNPFFQVVDKRIGDCLRYLVDQVLKAVGSRDLCLPLDRLAALRLLTRYYRTCLTIAERCEANARPDGQHRT